MEKINVTKSYLPSPSTYLDKLRGAFACGHLTNGGPLVDELTIKLRAYLDSPELELVANGTLAIQLALAALDISDGEVITTPFSYVATVSSILWERCTPVFVDIKPDNYTLDPSLIEAAITPKSKAILPVHVFGVACDVTAIERVADKYHLKVIYDGAHAFGSVYGGRSLLSYGDITTCSFHATKIFHTVEGGACISKDPQISKKIQLIKRFGHNENQHYCLGINAKMSEFHAAMGLAILPDVAEIIQTRGNLSKLYDELLAERLKQPPKPDSRMYNYAYYPVLFQNEQTLLNVFNALGAVGIFPRRYFYPSLNTLPYINKTGDCPISEDIASRIACLPLYPQLRTEYVEKICNIILSVL